MGFSMVRLVVCPGRETRTYAALSARFAGRHDCTDCPRLALPSLQDPTRHPCRDLCVRPLNAPYPTEPRLTSRERRSSKPAHSDLLQAIPQPPDRVLSYEEKLELSRPFIYVRVPSCASPRDLKLTT